MGFDEKNSDPGANAALHLPNQAMTQLLEEKDLPRSPLSDDHHVVRSPTPCHSSQSQTEDAPDNGVVTVFPGEKLHFLGEKMVLVLYLLKDYIRGPILAQFWVPNVFLSVSVLETRGLPYLCVPMLAEYRKWCSFFVAADSPFSLPGRVFTSRVPEWTSNVNLYRYPDEFRPENANSFGVKGSIAFPVFDSQEMSCCAVLELVTMEEKTQFDREMEKVFCALQAVNLRSNTSPRLLPFSECFWMDKKAVLAEIKDVISATCKRHGLPLALTWIPCDYTETVEFPKLRVRVGDSNLKGKHVLCIELAACYAEKETRGFLHACEQRHIEEGQGIAGNALLSNFPTIAADVKEFSVTEYPIVHHARKYGLEAAVAIRLRSTYTGDNDYILEFFLPVDMKNRMQQQYLFRNLPATLLRDFKSLRMVSFTELGGVQGSKVGFEEGVAQSTQTVPEHRRSRKTASFKGDLNSIDRIPLQVASAKNVGVESDCPHERDVRQQNAIINPVPNDDGKKVTVCSNKKKQKKSVVWEGFDKVREENGALWVICKGCSKKYPGDSTKGTSNLHKHLKSCLGKRQRNAQQHPSDTGRNLIFDQEESTKPH